MRKVMKFSVLKPSDGQFNVFGVSRLMFSLSRIIVFVQTRSRTQAGDHRRVTK
jgi:hypothetical protein